MAKTYDIDQDLDYKNILNKLDLTKNNGFYIFGKPGVGKTTFGKKIQSSYKTKIETLQQQITKLEQAYEVQNELYQQRLTANNIQTTTIFNAIKKYGSWEAWEKNECSFAENIEMNKIMEAKKQLEKKKNSLKLPIFMNMQKFISNIQDSWAKQYIDATKNTETAIIKAAHANLLILDDFGAEFIHESTYPYIYELFEKRYQNLANKKLTTIITSNYSLAQLKHKYVKKLADEIAVARLFSRIEGLLSQEIQFLGFDKRKNKINML